jgi:hypothetical protein
MSTLCRFVGVALFEAARERKRETGKKTESLESVLFLALTTLNRFVARSTLRNKLIYERLLEVIYRYIARLAEYLISFD